MNSFYGGTFFDGGFYYEIVILEVRYYNIAMFGIGPLTG
jgi:hypothetical protein